MGYKKLYDICLISYISTRHSCLLLLSYSFLNLQNSVYLKIKSNQPVISTNIANNVSWREKHRSSEEYFPLFKSRWLCFWIYERIPEKDTSIPFTTYGKGNNFLPLKNDQTLIFSSRESEGKIGKKAIRYIQLRSQFHHTVKVLLWDVKDSCKLLRTGNHRLQFQDMWANPCWLSKTIQSSSEQNSSSCPKYSAVHTSWQITVQNPQFIRNLQNVSGSINTV